MTNTKGPLNKLKHHVTGAIERGEKQAITAITEPKHTKGPWRVYALIDGDDSIGIHAGSGIMSEIAVIKRDSILGDLSGEEAKNNARLISVAPEMLEILEECSLMLMSDCDEQGPLNNRVDGVIAKAKGV